jgi:hypothetical protein
VGTRRAHTATAHSIRYPPESHFTRKERDGSGSGNAGQEVEMRALVAGASRAIGKPPRGAVGDCADHTLVGMTRSDRAAQPLGAVGAEPVVADALDAAVEHAVCGVRPEAMRDTLAASN